MSGDGGHVDPFGRLTRSWSGGRYKLARNLSCSITPPRIFFVSILLPPSPTTTTMVVKVISNVTEFKEAIKSERPAVFDFWATWCGPCKQISPIFEKLSNETDAVDFYKVDVDEAGDVAQEVGVRAMPTFMLFKESTKIGEVVGANPAGLSKLIQVPSA